ncbi:sigma-70 family RNA polymerase sigma factor [Fulvivirgaceae bacterium BMA12]|uniref:Sigma-70 family RNA polymerase sigma factor n=1 Tax=Agaribacillus aureus TaxID=3051825 RepID=A0ABT8LCR3_9BACT|nr:sigma-70 family RNA polymerase sigma factor [Fulvivirgaceae bacterium BMA12]
MNVLKLNRTESSAELSDLELWGLLKQGDRDAFQTIYQRYLKDLLNYGYHLVPKKAIVKDCVHDLFLDIWIRRSRLGDVSRIKYYLFKALSRRILAQKRQKDLYLDNLPEKVPYKITLPFEQKLIDRQESTIKSEKLRRAVRRLSDKQNEVINLLFYEGFSYEEAADIMNINRRSVYTLAWKAMSVLRKELKYVADGVISLIFYFLY